MPPNQAPQYCRHPASVFHLVLRDLCDAGLLCRGGLALFGDQTLFCRAADFRSVGGYDELLPIMEDVQLCITMHEAGPAPAAAAARSSKGHGTMVRRRRGRIRQACCGASPHASPRAALPQRVCTFTTMSVAAKHCLMIPVQEHVKFTSAAVCRFCGRQHTPVAGG